MPIQPTSSVPLGGTFWQALQPALPARAPIAPAPNRWATDQSWINRYGHGVVPGASINLSTVNRPSTVSVTGGSRAGSGRDVWLETASAGMIGSVSAALRGGGNVWSQPGLAYNGRMEHRLNQAMATSVASARRELSMGVRESGGANRGPRVDLYARTSRMNSGQMWCGFFVGFNYAQAGFKHADRLASTYKAQRFFLYQDANQLAEHRAQGSTRQFFLFAESRNRSALVAGQRNYPHFNVQANTFKWTDMPIRPGDTVLFQRSGQGYPTHIGQVESYDRSTGRLVTIEGNVDDRVVRKTYDLRDPAVRRDIAGIGRPAAGDFK